MKKSKFRRSGKSRIGLALQRWPVLFSFPWRASSAIRPAVAESQARDPLALDDDLAVPRAQLDLPNVAARAVNLLGDQSCARRATASRSSRHILAPMDANGCRRRIEIELQRAESHTSITAVAICCFVAVFATSSVKCALTIFGLGFSACARLRRSDTVLVPF